MLGHTEWTSVGLDRRTAAGTHRGGGGGVEVQQAADVRPGRVDGGVQAEAVRVHAQGGAAAVHHLPHNVHLHLGSRHRVTFPVHIHYSSWGTNRIA